jgi:lipopolysaccharide/colanic/teichoic acid biosynthesis glycosyltransferase
MLKSSPTIDTGELTLPNDPRVLTVGRFLRKTKLNELPQLWNILIGDLSFIGPRPQTKKYFSRFDEVDRLWVSKVRPGLSGVGSILFHDEETIISKVKDPQDFDDNVITPYKGHVERWFVLNQSLSLYFELIFTTVAVIFFPSAGFRQKLLVRLPSPPPEIYKLLI